MTELTQEEVISFTERFGFDIQDVQLINVYAWAWVVHAVGKDIICLPREEIYLVWRDPDENTIQNLIVYKAWTELNGEVCHTFCEVHDDIYDVELSTSKKNRVLIRIRIKRIRATVRITPALQ